MSTFVELLWTPDDQLPLTLTKFDLSTVTLLASWNMLAVGAGSVGQDSRGGIGGVALLRRWSAPVSPSSTINSRQRLATELLALSELSKNSAILCASGANWEQSWHWGPCLLPPLTASSKASAKRPKSVELSCGTTALRLARASIHGGLVQI